MINVMKVLPKGGLSCRLWAELVLARRALLASLGDVGCPAFDFLLLCASSDFFFFFLKQVA